MLELKQVMKSPAAIVLILMNCLPIWGVFVRDWDVGFIIAVYWVENVAVGLINILKILSNKQSEGNEIEKLGLSVFFSVHYGIFTLVHGMFVFVVFQQDGPFGGADDFPSFPSLSQSITNSLLLPFAGFFASHLFSYFYNYLGQGECRKLDLKQVMLMPYGRIVALHLVILFGAFLTMAAGSPKPVILLLVIVKTFGDLLFHALEHAKKPS